VNVTVSGWGAGGYGGDLRYSRVVSNALVQALQGPLRDVVAWRDADLQLRDVQLRREPKGRRSWVTLYLGLTSVLDVDELGGNFRCRAHPTHQERGAFDPSWSEWRALPEFLDVWPDIWGYLDSVVHRVDRQWTEAEGRVHALLGNGTQPGLTIIDREASVAFRDQGTKDRLLQTWRAPLLAALAGVGDGAAWSGPVTSTPFGTSPDFIAVDGDGRLLVLEAKPATATAGIVRGPAQVRLYAAMYAEWFAQDPDAVAVLNTELAQRQSVGLLPPDARTTLAEPVTIVPVLAIGPGVTSPEAWARLRAVQHAVHEAGPSLPHTEALEVWRLSRTTAPSLWRYEESEAPVLRDEDLAESTYAERARARAVSWRALALPEAVGDGPYPPRAGEVNRYPFCLPLEKAALNLLPEAATAPAFFRRRGIQWHYGVGGGPTNHLVSSQVQCVNALFAMTADPDLVHKAFGDVLPISEVLQIEPGAYLTFEYVGDSDHLNEGPHMSRGANRTSADAAIAYRTPDGAVEIALLEWKYTEQYRGQELSWDNQGVREKRYRDFWDDPAGPLLTADGPEPDGPLPYEDIFVEPFYQLARQQFLAWRMELAGERGATTVRVVHISPAANVAYQRSLNRPTHRVAGDTVKQVWQAMLRRPDRFVAVDSERFTDPALVLTSDAYRLRYGHG
jgi:hypothetical protein